MGSEQMCVDRVIPFHLAEEAEAIAIGEDARNASDAREKLALVVRKMWSNGRTLRVRFLDGTAKLQDRVKHYASQWTEHANLGFDFGSSLDAEIRVSFSFNPGRSWSALGTDCLVEKYFPRHQPTMNFGWFDDTTDETELSRVIVHEFGHAIGCIHEHQNPVGGGIQWDEQAVLKQFSGSPSFWDEPMIRNNILARYAEDQLKATRFDPDSIMLYAFPASLTTNGVGTRANDRLSKADIDFVRAVYPRP